MKLLRNCHRASLGRAVAVSDHILNDDGVAIDFAIACEFAASRVSVVRNCNVRAIDVGIDIRQETAEVRDADGRFADAGDTDRGSQCAAAAVIASVSADEFGTPLRIAEARSTKFVAIVTNAGAIEASTVRATINVFASVVITTGRRENQKCAQEKRREEKQFFAHVSKIFESDRRKFCLEIRAKVVRNLERQNFVSIVQTDEC